MKEPLARAGIPGGWEEERKPVSGAAFAVAARIIPHEDRQCSDVTLFAVSLLAVEEKNQSTLFTNHGTGLQGYAS